MGCLSGKVAPVNDLQMRLALHRQLQDLHGPPPGALILDELGLCQGSVRVDVALVNDRLNGYEIKGDGDSLERLAGQAAIYNRVLEMASIVVAERHLARATLIVPRWWGIAVASRCNNAVEIAWLRSAAVNTCVDPISLAQLLWRDEILSYMSQLGLDIGLRSKPRRTLWARLAEALTLGELTDLVRETLKRRGDWRSAAKATLV